MSTVDATGSPPLRVALVGCGRHARTTVIPALRAAGAGIRALCTGHADTARAAADDVGVANAYAGVDALLAAEAGAIDACVLVLPPDGYEEAVSACLAAGLPVYCEKPAALSSATLRRIEERAHAAKLPVMVGYMKRFAPAYERARGLSAQPAFGSLTAIQVRWAVGPGHRDLGYLLRENTSHVLDLMRYLGGEVTQVQAMTPARGDAVAVAAVVRFDGGAVGTLEASGAGAWDHDNETVTLTGTGPAVVVDNVETCILRVPGEPEQRWTPNHTVPLPRNASLHVTGFTGALEHFARVVAGTEPCRSDITSARRTMELAEAIESAAAGAAPAQH